MFLIGIKLQIFRVLNSLKLATMDRKVLEQAMYSRYHLEQQRLDSSAQEVLKMEALKYFTHLIILKYVRLKMVEILT